MVSPDDVLDDEELHGDYESPLGAEQLRVHHFLSIECCGK
jgi:hypothetical protein